MWHHMGHSWEKNALNHTNWGIRERREQMAAPIRQVSSAFPPDGWPANRVSGEI
jgi:hypothetical protein